MRIIIAGLVLVTESQLRKLLKESYKKGLNVGDGIGYTRRKMDESGRGTIMPSYDMDGEIAEIMERKGWR